MGVSLQSGPRRQTFLMLSNKTEQRFSLDAPCIHAHSGAFLSDLRARGQLSFSARGAKEFLASTSLGSNLGDVEFGHPCGSLCPPRGGATGSRPFLFSFLPSIREQPHVVDRGAFPAPNEPRANQEGPSANSGLSRAQSGQV